MPNYTAPDGTVYTSPEVARQNGVSVPANISSGVDIQTQTQQANALLQPQAVPVNNLGATQAITLPTPTPTVNPTDGTVASATAMSKDLANYTPPPAPSQGAFDTANSAYQSSLQGMTGQGATQVASEQAAGIPQISTDIAALNSQILMATADANKTNASYEQAIANLDNPNNLQQRGTMAASTIGASAQIRKMQLAEANSKSADINLLLARALGLQGQLKAAQDHVNRAVNLMYADRQAEIDIKKAQLDAISGQLTKEEKQIAGAWNLKYAEQQKQIEEEKAEAKDNLNLALQAGVQTTFVNKNGKFFDARTGKTFASPQDFFKAAGVTSFDEAYQKGLVTDVNGSTMADKNFVAEARAKYPDANIQLTDTQEQVMAKLQNSRLYRKDTYIAPNAYTNPVPTGIVNPQIDARVKQIITSNPGQYGNAANQIRAEFDSVTGANTAQLYDNWLRRVYNYGQDINVVASDKAPTEGAYLAAGFAGRMEQANSTIESTGNTIKSMNFATYKMNDLLPSSQQSDAFRQFKQAVTNFITAKLRKESGASIAPSEFEDAYRVYIPQPGDDQTTLQNKANVRTSVIKDMASQAGNALQIPSSSQTQISSGGNYSTTVPIDGKPTVFTFPTPEALNQFLKEIQGIK
jgi:hypothetical protein